MSKQLIKFDYTRGMGVIKCVPTLFGILRDHFSVENKAKKAIARHYSDHYIDPHSYAITPSGQFDVWMASEILKFLKKKGVEITVEASDRFMEAFRSKFDFGYTKGEIIKELELNLRDYQKEGVSLALEHGNGIFLYPTSAGKTLTMATTIHNIVSRKPDAKILVVTLTHLVPQLYNDFSSYGMDMRKVSMWTGENEINLNSNIIIAGSVILGNHLKFSRKEYETNVKVAKVCRRGLKSDGSKMNQSEKSALEEELAKAEANIDSLEAKVKKNDEITKYIESVYAVFIDEVHQCKKDNIITKLFSKLKTNHRFGYTGTMPNEKIDEWTILGKVGPIRQVVNRDDLVTAGNITDVEVRFVDLHYKTAPQYERIDDSNWQASLENFRIESEFLYESKFRNSVITHICASVPRNILVLVDRIEHGEYLKRQIQEKAPDKKVIFIYGEVDKDERETIRKEMESANNIVCIAITKIFSTGVSIKNIHFLLFAVAWKTRVSIIQSIGRGVRAMEGKTKVVLFDMHDCLRYGTKHYQERLGIYENEGFSIKNQSVSE